MAHQEQLSFVRLARDHFLREASSVLEIGAYDVNGSVRSLFSVERYVGVDLIEGPGVDVVCYGHEVAFPAESFDVVISCECFEHDPHWADTFTNMHRMSREVVLFTCASKGRGEHGTRRTATENSSPGTAAMGSDYYRNLTARDFRKLPMNSMFRQYRFFYEPRHRDLFFIGWKHGTRDLTDFSREVEAISAGYRPSLVRRIAVALPERIFQNVLLLYRRFR